MPGPFSGGTGGAVGGTLGAVVGGGVGAPVGAALGTWIEGLFGGGRQGTAEHVSQLLTQEFSQYAFMAEFLAPKLGDLRDFSQGLDPYDPNYARWFMQNIVTPIADDLLAANSQNSVQAFNRVIGHAQSARQHHGPGHPGRSDPRTVPQLNAAVEFCDYIKSLSTQAISIIEGGGVPQAGGGTPAGGNMPGGPLGGIPPGGQTPGFAVPSKTAIIVIVGAALGLLMLGKRG